MKDDEIEYQYKKELNERIDSLLKKAELQELSVSDYYTLYLDYKLLQEKKEYQSKIEKYKQIIEGITYDTSANLSADDYCSLSMFYFDEKQYDKSIENINKAISLNPECADYYLIKGDYYNKRGKQKEADLEYSKAISLDPQREETINLLKDCDKTINEASYINFILKWFLVVSFLYLGYLIFKDFFQVFK